MCFACSLQKFSSMFSLLFSSNFSLRFNKVIFALKRNEGKTFFGFKPNKNRSLLLRTFRFRFKKKLFLHNIVSKLSFGIKKNLFRFWRTKPLAFASNFSFTLESDRRIHFSTFPCRNTCRRLMTHTRQNKNIFIGWFSHASIP